MSKPTEYPIKLTESDSWHILNGQIKEYHHIQQLAHSTAKGAFSVIVGFTSIVVLFFAYFDIETWQTTESLAEISSNLPFLREFTGDMIIFGIIQSSFIFMTSVILLVISIMKIIDVLSQEPLLPISQVNEQQEMALERDMYLGSPPNYTKWIKSNRGNIKKTRAKFRASHKMLIISPVLLLLSIIFLLSSGSGNILILFAFTMFVTTFLSGCIYSIIVQIIYSILQRFKGVSKTHDYTIIGLNIIRFNKVRTKYSGYTSPSSLFLFVYILAFLASAPSVGIILYWVYQEYLYTTLIVSFFLILLGVLLLYIYLEVLDHADDIPFDYIEKTDENL